MPDNVNGAEKSTWDSDFHNRLIVTSVLPARIHSLVLRSTVTLLRLCYSPGRSSYSATV